jgi:Arc/MetJ-type ribon-helix-helix transcriptional regulator
MPETKLQTIQVRIPVDLLQWIDDFRNSMKVLPSRSEAIRYLIEQGKEAETGPPERPRVRLADDDA